MNTLHANELRIGNWINDLSGGATQVRGVTTGGIWITDHAGPGTEIAFSGIPLTEEWLIKFGFKKNESLFENIILPYWVNNAVCLFFNGSPPENTYLSGYGFSTFTDQKYYCATMQWIQYVHQLQNLYFALTGKELTLTPETK